MKHLKRIFESTEKLDTEYIKMCFVDFLDQEEFDCEVDTLNDGRDYISIMPSLPGIVYKDGKFSKRKLYTFEDSLEEARENYEFYENIDTCKGKNKIS